jgi:hypothetical protein
MAALLILRSETPGTADQYYLTGTGWQSTESAGTQYSTWEAALPDGETLQQTPLGVPYGHLLVIKDLSTGTERPVPTIEP